MGLVIFCFVILGVDLCIGLYKVLFLFFVFVVFSEVDGNILRDLVNIVVLLESMLLKRLFVIIILNCFG